MNNLEELFEAEIKNLYALEKQILAVLPSVEKEVDDEELQKQFAKLIEQGNEQIKVIQKQLDHFDYNPGNTFDQVANEMILNLNKISSKSFSSEIKDAGLIASLTRLFHYKTACYTVTLQMARELEHDDEAQIFQEILQSTKKRLKKIKKLAEESIYGEADE